MAKQSNTTKSVSSSISDTTTLPFIVTNKAISLTIISLIIFAVSGSVWWKQVYNSPRRVFEGMLKTNLTTQSVTRTTVSDDSSSAIEKYEQLSFVPPMASRTAAVINQGSGDSETHVISETVGTNDADYSRYVKIDTNQKGSSGNKLDYSNVLNIWGNSPYPQAYPQTVLGLIPFANLKAKDLPEMLTLFTDSKAYEVDYSSVEPRRIDGKSALVFSVKINTGQYVKVLKTIASRAGFSDFADLNPDDYANSAPITVKLTVDKLSRQLLEADYVDTGQKEQYSAYGLSLPVLVPEKYEYIESLQQKIQEIQ